MNRTRNERPESATSRFISALWGWAVGNAAQWMRSTTAKESALILARMPREQRKALRRNAAINLEVR